MIRSFFESKSHFRSSAFKKRAILSKKFDVFTTIMTVFHCFSPFYAQERIAISLFRSHKTSDSLEKPKSEFSTLFILGEHDDRFGDI